MTRSNVKLKSTTSKNKCKQSVKSKPKTIKSKPSPKTNLKPKSKKPEPKTKLKAKPEPKLKSKTSLKSRLSFKPRKANRMNANPRSKTSFKTWLFRRSSLRVREDEDFTDNEYERNLDQNLTGTPGTTDVTGTTETSPYGTDLTTSGSFREGDRTEEGTPIESTFSSMSTRPPCKPCDIADDATFGTEARRFFPRLGQFKACERFLKRVAYNLGNSASQTEVKIISCIPIDVTDFQKRIRQLEKQLLELVMDKGNKDEGGNKDESGKKDENENKDQVGAGLEGQPEGAGKPVGEGKPVGSDKVGSGKPDVNRKPSTTTRSCYCPDNAKQKAGLKLGSPGSKGTETVRTTFTVSVKNIGDGTLNSENKENEEKPLEVNFLHINNKCAETAPQYISDMSFVEPAHKWQRLGVNRNIDYSAIWPFDIDTYDWDDDQKAPSVGIYNRDDDKRAPSARISKNQGSTRMTISRKIKNSIKQRPDCTPVYYAQTDSPHFNDNPPTSLSRSYLTNMINKQYKSKLLAGDASQLSDFSSPVCKDTIEAGENCAYISDMCLHCYETYHSTKDNPKVYGSSCDEAFHDIDNQPCGSPQVHKSNQNFRADNISNEGSFYDSTFYDVVPVKEKPMKAKKTLDDMSNNKVLPATVEMMCWPENARTKFSTVYLDYRISSTRTDKVLKRSTRLKRKDGIAKNSLKFKNNNLVRKIEMSKSSCIDFGEVYPKIVKKRENRYLYSARKCLVSTQVPSKVDAECLTTPTINSECQTLPLTTATNKSVDKSQVTVKQIKAILQSVLREVKANTSSKDGSSEKPKKEAKVQNGVSQGTVLEPLHPNVLNNLEASRILNSITYNPCDIHPYIPSCSKQNNSCQYCYAQTSLKKYQNFPILVQNSERPTCPHCYGHHMKCHCRKQAKATATNTDSIKTEHSQVTDKLIKEIYKAMALTMGAIKKENSDKYEPIQDISSYVDKQAQSIKESKKTAKVMQSISEMFKTKDIQTPSDSHNTCDSKFRSYYENTLEFQSTATETRSFSQSTNAPTDDVNMKYRSIRIQKFLSDPKSDRSEESVQEKSLHMMGENLSETISDYTYFVPQQSTQVQQKKGLLSKMLKSVKLLKSKVIKTWESEHTNVQEPAKEEYLSDSNDYQTISSEEIDLIQKQKPRGHNLTKRRTHSKISYKGRESSREKVAKRTPYMEQEYRRQWDEKLMFHDGKIRLRHTPCAAYSQVMNEGTPQRGHPYSPTYETRTAFVEAMRKNRVSQTHKKKLNSKKLGN